MEILPEGSNLVKCACGCGATFAAFNKGGYGPRKFLHGHNPSSMIGYIRSLSNPTNYAELAVRFGVAKRTIWDVVKGFTWRHIGPPMVV